MSLRRLLGPLVIVAVLVFAGALQPLLDKARADTINISGGQDPGPTAIQTRVQTVIGQGKRTWVPNQQSVTALTPFLGTPYGGPIPPDQAKGVGPVDQNAALDFSTQPKSVPHSYAPGRVYNVQVLKKYDYAGLVGQMAYFTQALGVQCTYCHNVKNYAYDTPTKLLARNMLQATVAINDSWVTPDKSVVPTQAVTGAVGCATCHRGSPRIDVHFNIVPVQYVQYHYKTTKQLGYVYNAMYGVARSLGVNCLFCHNTADFITLRYYPTNKLALRMFYMVDQINHHYFPPSVKAVTCYTCHQGEKWPSALVKAGDDQTPVQSFALQPDKHYNPGDPVAMNGNARNHEPLNGWDTLYPDRFWGSPGVP
ncbi:MAG: photosynthetic reaction center cytochrome c subunit family protein [Candidatus Velthaea sp.]